MSDVRTNRTGYCPHPNCTKPIASDKYACTEHWFSLPYALRNEIIRGYRRSTTTWVRADRKAKAMWNEKIKREAGADVN